MTSSILAAPTEETNSKSPELMTSDILKQIGKHSFVYSVGSLLNRMIGFFMIPIYTRYLTPKDYGLIELLDVTIYVIGVIIGIGMSGAILRYYYDCRDQVQQNQVVSTALIFATFSQAGALLALYLVREDISSLVFQTKEYGAYFQWVFLTLCLNTLSDIGLTYIRAKQQSSRYVVVSVARLFLSLSLNIYLIVHLQMGVWGVVYSGVISSAIAAVFLVSTTLWQTKLSFCKGRLKQMLGFGAPLVPASLGMFVLMFADRFFLGKYATLSDVGVYSLGCKLSMVMSAMITSPFLLFWSAYMYEIAEKANAKYLFARIQVYFTLVLIFVGLGISLLADDLVRLLAPREYWEATNIIPLIVMSQVVGSVSYVFQVGISLSKKTKYMAYALGGSALLNVALNYLLIPSFQAQGAAWATLLSFAAMSAGKYVFSQRLYSIQHEYSRIAKMVLLGFAIFFVSRFLHFGSTSSSILGHGLLSLSFPFALWSLGFYNAAEIRMIRNVCDETYGRIKTQLKFQ